MELDRLRSLAALAHVVPGVRVHLSSATGADVVIDRTSDADLDPCAFRRVVLHAVEPGASRLHDAVSASRLSGAVEECGGDLYRSVADGRNALHWLVTRLNPRLAFDALAEGPSEHHEVEIEACLRGDPTLGLTVVRLEVSGADPDLAHVVCRSAQSACLAAEVEQHLMTVGSGASERRS